MSQRYLFTSESVTDGHPDRLCDTISDAIVDRFLIQDPQSHIVTECALSKNLIFIAARFASQATVDIPEVARLIVAETGYRSEDFNAAECTVVTSLMAQADTSRYQWDERELDDRQLDRIVVRNQTTQFGFACNQTPDFMPYPMAMAHQLARRLRQVRQNRTLAWLSPDCTTQVGVEFDQRKPVRIHSVTLIVGYQGDGHVDAASVRQALIREVIEPVFATSTLQPDDATEIHINPRGSFTRNGPAAHSGMTGRKTTSDSYGGYARHSGSALSGKDPGRIDRVAAYAARHAARNVVAAGLAEQCEVQLSYTIDQARPVSVRVLTYGTGTVADALIQARVEDAFDFRLGAIIRDFNLRHLPTLHRGGFYRHLPVQGHHGASFTELPWEQSNRIDRLR